MTESQIEPDLNHFQSLKEESISKWHPLKFPQKMFYNSLFLYGLNVTMIILQLVFNLYFILIFLKLSIDKLYNSYLELITSVSLLHKLKFYKLK